MYVTFYDFLHLAYKLKHNYLNSETFHRKKDGKGAI